MTSTELALLWGMAAWYGAWWLAVRYDRRHRAPRRRLAAALRAFTAGQSGRPSDRRSW